MYNSTNEALNPAPLPFTVTLSLQRGWAQISPSTKDDSFVRIRPKKGNLHKGYCPYHSYLSFSRVPFLLTRCSRTFPSLAFNSHLSFSCIQLAPFLLLHSTRTSPSLAFNSHLSLSCIQLAPLPLLHSTRTSTSLAFNSHHSLLTFPSLASSHCQVVSMASKRQQRYRMHL